MIISRCGRQLLIAASALVTVGVGTSLKHELVVKADAVDTTSSTADTTSSSTTNTQTNNNSTTTNDSQNSDTGDKSVVPTTSSAQTTDSSTSSNTQVSKAPQDTSPTVSSTDTSTPATITPTIASVVTPTDDAKAATMPVASSVTSTPATESVQPTTTETVSTQATATETPATTSPAATTTQPTTPAPVSSVASTSNDFLWDTDDTNSTATVTGVNGDYTEINIPSTVNLNSKDYNVTAVGDNAFVGNKNITSVTINNGIQTIGDGAFAYIPNLTTVDMSNNKTLTTIGNDAFTSSKVSTITIPDSVTSIGNDAFAYNSNLSSINLGSSLTSIGSEAFASDSQLTSITLPSTLQTIGDSAFTSDTGITTIDFGSNSHLTSIGDSAFAYNVSLIDLNLPDSVQTIGDSAFLSDIALQSVKLDSGLISIGNNAFLYDGKLTSLDMTAATNLSSIGNGAFEYSGITGSLTFGNNLKTIGSQAFTGNNINGVTFGTNLQSIGDSAFSYNKISGNVTIPATTTSVGSQAFLGNQISSVTLAGSNTKINDSAFQYNRITQISAPSFTAIGNLATNQLATIFTDPTHDTIADLFNLKVDGFTEENMNISGLTNGVTYSYKNGIGTFNIPAGTDSFTFDWALTNGYVGQYNVVLNNPDIKVIGSQIVVGSTWNPQDNFVSAQLQNGDPLDFDDLKVAVKDTSGNLISTVDTSVPGNYSVTYSYGNDSTTVTVAVLKKDGTYQIIGSADGDYSGENQVPDGSNYSVELSNGTIYNPQNGDLEIVGGDAKDAGTYSVTLSQQGIDNISKLQQSSIYNWASVANNIATYTINKANVVLVANNASKIAGQADPKLTVTVQTPATLVNSSDLDYTVERTSGDDVGTYPITVTYKANPNYNVTVVNGIFDVLPSKSSLSGSDYTMHIGDPTPTVSDFKASATGENGEIVPVLIDLSKVNYSVAGNYNVELSTTDGQSKTVILHLLANNTSTGSGGGSGSTTSPTNPTEPTKPVEPTNPVEPTDPTNPTEPSVPEVPTNPSKPSNSEPVLPQKPKQSPTISTESSHESGKLIVNKVQTKALSQSATDHLKSNVITPSDLKNTVTLTNNKQVVFPATTETTAQKDWAYPAQTGKLPQTGSSNGTLTSLIGIVIAALGLLGIDIKKRKI